MNRQNTTCGRDEDCPDEQEERICHEVLRVLQALKSRDVSDEIRSRKEAIFGLVNQKVHAHRKKERTAARKWSFRAYMPYAAAVILLLAGVGLSTYQFGYGVGIADLQEAQVVVKSPMGVITDVSLPDGSKVTLNAGSTLTYPSFFRNDRRVTLNGEAYFDVVKDEVHPFIVRAKGMSVKVLGTRFSLKAYQQEMLTFLTLEEGSVEAVTTIGHVAENIVLIPNQQLMLNNRTGEFRRRNVDTNYYTQWRDGKLIFRNIPLESIAHELERRFNVQILFKDTIYKAESYYVTFEQDEGLDQILALLSYMRAWQYKIKGRSVEIIERK